MIPIERATEGMLVFLECGCGGLRALSHPTGGAALMVIKQVCAEHVGYDEPIEGTLVRSIPRGALVSPFVRAALAADHMRSC